MDHSSLDRLLRSGRTGPAATAWPLGEPSTSFPIDTPYRARPDLVKLNDAPILLEDRDWQEWINEKEEFARRHPLVLVDPHISATRFDKLTQRVISFFQSHVPDGPIDQNGHFPWRDHYRPQSALEALAALSLSLQEDFAIMADPGAGALQAAVLSVCFPSGWNPAEKIGQSMAALHEPVADNTALQSAMPALSLAMSTKGPFVRHVWTLADSAVRSRRPGEVQPRPVTHVRNLWFRWERQITIPLGEGVSLFLIRLGLADYETIIRDKSDHDRLIETLESMTPAMIAYKGLHQIRELVLQSSVP